MMITITCKEGRKIIDRVDVDLPPEAKWICQDADGEMMWFKGKPSIHYECDWWVRSGNRYGLTNLFHYWESNPDWKDSLIKVSDIK